MTYRASIAERIAWTTALRPVDARVLQALATFAHFESGQRAFMGMDKLVARAGLAKRTVERALQHLEAEGWIVATRRHRHATRYDIEVDRLATNYVGAKVVTADPRSVRQVGGQPHENLSATFADLSAKSGEFVRQLGGPIPSTYPDVHLSAPALIAPGPSDAVGADENPKTSGGESGMAVIEGATPATRAGDVRTDGRDRARGPDVLAVDPGGLRIDGGEHPPASTTGVPVRQGADPPSDRRADQEPHHLSLGPQSMSLHTPEEARVDSFRQLANVMRAALKEHPTRKSG